MQKNHRFPLTLIALAMLAACSTTPKSHALSEAHNSYNNASSNPQVTTLAALELKEASDLLAKADKASTAGESEKTVDHLAYLTKQQVEIAQATAQRKTAEIAVTNAATKRDQVRLAARTNEADAAKRQVSNMQITANQQAGELAAASANAERDKARLDANAVELAAASADAERDKALIAQQEILLKELNAKKTERGLVITLGDVLFNTNKAQLKPRGVGNVQKLAGFLTKYPSYKVLVEGHTDSTGSSDHNQMLSEQRANAVRSALVNAGISNERVATRGYGEEMPIASNDTAASRQLNRRVEIILSDDKGNITQR
ncbi:MAG: OmpA family protein [Methylophilaceae bacterium]|nr:OmpA family protein [Methylophilaceae bacterium]